MKIIILGGGFGGVKTAIDLDKKLNGSAEITLIDRNGYHLLIPMLYEVASAYGIKRDTFNSELRRTVALPFNYIFEGRGINFVQAEIKSVDLNQRLVFTSNDYQLNYDYLVLALGSQASDFGIPGVKDYAFQFKSMDDALLVNEKIQALFAEKASEKKASPVTLLVAGAGFTGIELAAELASAARKFKKKMKFTGPPAIIYIFEALDKILPTISDKEREAIRRRLTDLGVIIMESSPIEEVQANSVKLKSGQIVEGDMVMWTAGIEPNALLKRIEGLELTSRGKIIVGEHLHISKFKNVFAVGDNIEFIDHVTQKPIPSLAYLAIDHGRVAAKNIFSSIQGKELSVHRPFYEVWIAPVGGKYAVAHLGHGMSVSGLMGWIVRELVDLRYLVRTLSFRRALELFFREYRVFTKND